VDMGAVVLRMRAREVTEALVDREAASAAGVSEPDVIEL